MLNTTYSAMNHQTAILAAVEKIPDHPLSSFAVIYPLNIEWGDMDAFNHVNNVMYYEYAQRARIFFQAQAGLFDEATRTVVAASSCQYYKPVTYPDVLWIGVRAKKVGNTSVVHEYVYYSTAQDAVVAIGDSVLVFFSQDGMAKRPITEPEKAALLALDRSVKSTE